MTPATLDTPPAVHRILVVDDNRAIQEDFRKILGADLAALEFDREEAGFFGSDDPAAAAEPPFALDFASQGREALEKVTAAKTAGEPYAVVFMDVRMPPGWDGIETTARLWQVDADLQVVICTAYSDYSREQIVTALGSSDRLLILKKPFDVIEVVQCAHALAGKWSLLQQTREHALSLEATVAARTAELEATNARLEREIGERRRSEEALRFTQFSVDNASDAMFWVAPDGGLRYANAATCRTLGYSLRELHGMTVLEIVPELRESGWLPFWESFRNAPHRTFEARHQAKSGREIPIELTATLFAYGGQELLCVSARDITVRKRILADLSAARDAALESVRLKSQFLANMSHEIRTPMNGVIGMAELLIHTNLDRDQRQYTDTIRTSADSLLYIINDILDSSKIESGTVVFDAHDFNLHSVVDGTLDLISGTAQAKGIELAGYVPADVFPDLRGDAGRLRQVLTNIVGNAVKFTASGEVVLKVAPVAETADRLELRFEVRDTGIGISPEACLRIFEPFMQADGSDTRKYGGTGLGLTICRQIVEALGGKIGVTSEPGAGATFWFTLAFEKQAARPAAGPREIACPPDLRVIAVDDNPTNRQILDLQLRNLRLRPDCAEDGHAALEALYRANAAGSPYHIALIDMQMPGMNGLTLARRIKSDPGLSTTRLVLLSSLGEQVSDAELRAAGIEGYLVKPLKQTRLGQELATLFTRRPGPLPATPESRGPVAAQPLRILLAEDNPINRQVALLQLKSLGYSADVANDGAEAVQAMENVPYDLILMDCQMPNVDGYEATRRIRGRHDRPVKIIAMTANAMPGDHEKCLAAGMDAYLSKPVNPRELGRLLDQCRNEIPAPPEPVEAPPPAAACEPVDLERLTEITGGNAAMLRQLSQDYLEQAEEILALLVLAIERGASRDIHQLAHKLCGSSASCGMRAIVAPLVRLEQLGKSAQLASAVEYQREAVQQLARIRKFLIRQLEKEPPPPKSIA